MYLLVPSREAGNMNRGGDGWMTGDKVPKDGTMTRVAQLAAGAAAAGPFHLPGMGPDQK